VPETLVADVDDLRDGGRVFTSVAGLDIVVFRHDSRLYAFENKCLHSGGPVGEGMLIGKVEAVLGADGTVLGERFSDDEIHLVCPWHGWEYDIGTGACAGNRSFQLRRFDVTEREGAVFVSVP
jgi:nitrite reductase/ring-hydroxylating ferredoxin subunit